jgi:hypothetical protein
MATKIRITYTDPARPADVVTLGAFSQVAAKRRYGLDAMKSDDPEVALFACLVELEGPARSAEPDALDQWLQTVQEFELVRPAEADPEDPSPAETPSSQESPGSPPTSD